MHKLREVPLHPKPQSTTLEFESALFKVLCEGSSPSPYRLGPRILMSGSRLSPHGDAVPLIP